MSSNNIFGNTDWINEENTLQLLPPTVQWYRGDLKDKDKRIKSGCWELQTDSFEAILGNSQEAVEVLHSGGKVVRAYLFDKIHVAVLAYKKRWYTLDSNNQMHFGEYEEGSKSKLQYYCLIKELGGESGMVSVSGLNARYLSEASKQFQKKVLRPAMQMAKRPFGQHHFWMPLASLGKIDTKQNQYITPPGLALPEINQNIIKELFIGQEIGVMAESLITEARAWAKGPETQAATQNMPEPPPAWYDDEVPEEQAITEDEIPF